MSASERRSNVRTSVVWQALSGVLGPESPDGPGRSTEQPVRVLDIGGGTGGFAVEVARRGHQVTVVDPSPDALAALDRRAAEAGVVVSGHQGDLSSLLDVVAPGSAEVVLCHGVLEVVDDPVAALATIGQVLVPGGTLSLLVAQRHSAVIARAMAGHFQQAREMLEGTPTAHEGTPYDGRGRRPARRFTLEELSALVAEADLTWQASQAVRVFADLVPGSLLDLEPGASAALVALEQAVAGRPEYVPLAAQLHVLATR